MCVEGGVEGPAGSKLTVDMSVCECVWLFVSILRPSPRPGTVQGLTQSTNHPEKEKAYENE